MEERCIEHQARILSLELKRDEVLEHVERLTAAIYSEITKLEHLEKHMGIPDGYFDEEDGLMA